MNSEKYPFEEEWPIEGFPLNKEKGQFVQIRICSCTQTKPPYKDYPPTDSFHPGVYKWWEVHLCFRPYTSEASRDGSYMTLHGKTGRKLKAPNQSRCIARFETKEEAKFFTHKLHQSEKQINFFACFP